MPRQRHRKDRSKPNNRENELVRVLVPERNTSDQAVEKLVNEVSESFGGSVTFGSEGVWVDRAGDLRTQEFAVIEIVVERDNQEV